MHVGARGQDVPKSVSCLRLWINKTDKVGVLFTPKEKRSQVKNVLYIVFFLHLTLYMVCLHSGFPVFFGRCRFFLSTEHFFDRINRPALVRLCLEHIVILEISR